MREDQILEVHARRKRIEGLVTILVGVFILSIIFYYVVFLRELLADTVFGTIVGYIKSNIASFNAFGGFFTALFGGLFFIFVPQEAYFLKALSNSGPIILYSVFIAGIIISYSIDYFIGMKFSKISRKLISPKKFYKTKSYINRYGKLAIFAASALPLFPSQQVTFILGVFRYNKARLAILTLTAQMLKYSYLLVIYSRF